MRFKYSDECGFQVLSIEGDIRVNNLMELKKEFQALLKDKTNLAVDLEKVQAMDSSGVSLFVNVHKKLQSEDREMCFFGLSEPVRKVMAEANLDKVFQCFGNHQEFIHAHTRKVEDELYPPPGYNFGDKYYVLKNLRCVLCNCEDIKGFILDKRTQELAFDGSLVPSWSGKEGNNTLDFYALQMIICPCCFFATRHIVYFTDLKGEFVSRLEEKEIHTLVKDDSARNRLLQGSTMSSMDKFYPPYSPREAYWVYRLAEECAHVLNRVDNRLATYDLAYYNILLTRYCSEKEMPEILRKAYMWYGEIWKCHDRFSVPTVIEALYYLTVLSVKLKRNREGDLYFNELKALDSPHPDYKRYLKAALVAITPR